MTKEVQSSSGCFRAELFLPIRSPLSQVTCKNLHFSVAEKFSLATVAVEMQSPITLMKLSGEPGRKLLKGISTWPESILLALYTTVECNDYKKWEMTSNVVSLSKERLQMRVLKAITHRGRDGMKKNGRRRAAGALDTKVDYAQNRYSKSSKYSFSALKAHIAKGTLPIGDRSIRDKNF